MNTTYIGSIGRRRGRASQVLSPATSYFHSEFPLVGLWDSGCSTRTGRLTRKQGNQPQNLTLDHGIILIPKPLLKMLREAEHRRRKAPSSQAFHNMIKTAATSVSCFSVHRSPNARGFHVYSFLFLVLKQALCSQDCGFNRLWPLLPLAQGLLAIPWHFLVYLKHNCLVLGIFDSKSPVVSNTAKLHLFAWDLTLTTFPSGFHSNLFILSLSSPRFTCYHSAPLLHYPNVAIVFANIDQMLIVGFSEGRGKGQKLPGIITAHAPIDARAVLLSLSIYLSDCLLSV